MQILIHMHRLFSIKFDFTVLQKGPTSSVLSFRKNVPFHKKKKLWQASSQERLFSRQLQSPFGNSLLESSCGIRWLCVRKSIHSYAALAKYCSETFFFQFQISFGSFEHLSDIFTAFLSQIWTYSKIPEISRLFYRYPVPKRKGMWTNQHMVENGNAKKLHRIHLHLLLHYLHFYHRQNPLPTLLHFPSHHHIPTHSSPHLFLCHHH